MGEEYIRSPLIKSLYGKLEHQRKHANTTHEYWYTCQFQFLSAEIARSFIKCEQDEETNKFLANCFEKSDWIFTHFYHAIAKACLTWFMTSTSINGLLGRGSMFVFSSSQFRKLLNFDENSNLNALLDLGAGDGNVTMKMASYFKQVYVTEISVPMQWRLKQLGFTLLDTNSWDAESTANSRPAQYDVVSCLNLLDRCSTPLTLLRRISKVLKPQTGILVLGIVLPIKQYVETTVDHKAEEVLDISYNEIWEIQLTELVHNVLMPTQYELIRWTRLPYLCEGDFTQSFYHLNDIVLVLKFIG